MWIKPLTYSVGDTHKTLADIYKSKNKDQRKLSSLPKQNSFFFHYTWFRCDNRQWQVLKHEDTKGLRFFSCSCKVIKFSLISVNPTEQSSYGGMFLRSSKHLRAVQMDVQQSIYCDQSVRNWHKGHVCSPKKTIRIIVKFKLTVCESRLLTTTEVCRPSFTNQ